MSSHAMTLLSMQTSSSSYVLSVLFVFLVKTTLLQCGSCIRCCRSSCIRTHLMHVGYHHHEESLVRSRRQNPPLVSLSLSVFSSVCSSDYSAQYSVVITTFLHTTITNNHHWQLFVVISASSLTEYVAALTLGI